MGLKAVKKLGKMPDDNEFKELDFKLKSGEVRGLYLEGKYGDALNCAKRVLENIKNPYYKASIYYDMMDIYTNLGGENLKEALKVAKIALRLLGHSIRLNPTKKHLITLMLTKILPHLIWKFGVERKKVNSLGDKTLNIKKREVRLILKIVARMMPPSYLDRNFNLLKLAALTNFHKTLLHGSTGESCYGFLGMGMFFCEQGKYDWAVNYANAAMKLAERSKDQYLIGRMRFAVNCFITHLTASLKTCVKELERATFECSDTGNPLDAGLASLYSSVYDWTLSLPQFKLDLDATKKFIEELGDKTSLELTQVYLSYVTSRLDGQDHFRSIDLKNINGGVEEFLVRYLKGKFLLNRGLPLDIIEASKLIMSAGTFAEDLIFPLVDYHFYKFLVLNLAPKKNREAIKKELAWMKGRFLSCKENCGSRYFLMLAEDLMACGKNDGLKNYVAAKKYAYEAGDFEMLAVIAEMHANSLLKQGFESMAKGLLWDSVKAYKEWGCVVKERSIQSKHTFAFNKTEEDLVRSSVEKFFPLPPTEINQAFVTFVCKKLKASKVVFVSLDQKWCVKAGTYKKLGFQVKYDFLDVGKRGMFIQNQEEAEKKGVLPFGLLNYFSHLNEAIDHLLVQNPGTHKRTSKSKYIKNSAYNSDCKSMLVVRLASDVFLYVESEESLNFSAVDFSKTIFEMASYARKAANSSRLSAMPKAVREIIEKTGKPPLGVLDNVSIFQCDIVGFTKLSSTLSPEKVAKLLVETSEPIMRLAKKHGLTFLKTIADACLVVGGAPLPMKNGNRAILRFAFDVLDFIQLYNKQQRKLGGREIEIRVGVSGGKVIQGVFGGEERSNYDVFGGDVNTACRMEKYGKKGKVHVPLAFMVKHRSELSEFGYSEPEKKDIPGLGIMKTVIVCRKQEEKREELVYNEKIKIKYVE